MLGIIIVTYKSYDRIRDYVFEDLLGYVSAGNGKIVVVDVGSERSSAERIAELLEVTVGDFDSPPKGDVTVLHVRENLGYARANNYGVRYLLKHIPQTEAFLFSNEDVRFTKGPVLETLMEKLRALPDAGTIGPDIVDMQGSPQGPLMYNQSIWFAILNNFCEPLFGHGFLRGSFASGKTPAELERKPGPVCVLSGCFFLVRASDFLQAGMFDERTFLYWEEEILSRRMEAIGKRLYFEDSVQVRHLVGGTMPRKDRPNTLQAKNLLAGAKLYYRDYDRRNILERTLLGISGAFRMTIVYLAVWKFQLKKLLGLLPEEKG
ncbi:MAG: glycosyltransferase family 2 protein [Victivallales bacterium]|nr:glycosyltransferase family 2 protein [Victivallales bacterium]